MNFFKKLFCTHKNYELLSTYYFSGCKKITGISSTEEIIKLLDGFTRFEYKCLNCGHFFHHDRLGKFSQETIQNMHIENKE